MSNNLKTPFFGAWNFFVTHGGKTHKHPDDKYYWDDILYWKIRDEWYAVTSIENDEDWAPKDIPVDRTKYPYPEYEFILEIKKSWDPIKSITKIRRNSLPKELILNQLPEDCPLRYFENNAVVDLKVTDIIESTEKRLITAAPITFILQDGHHVTFDPNGGYPETVIFR